MFMVSIPRGFVVGDDLASPKAAGASYAKTCHEVNAVASREKRGRVQRGKKVMTPEVSGIEGKNALHGVNVHLAWVAWQQRG
jgi:hypothetical protein